MKAVILAAGKGTRMGALTQDSPKCMLEFLGRTLLKRQLDLFHDIGIEEPIIVAGYMAQKIGYPGSIKIVNEDYDKTNMIESLFCSRSNWDDAIVVSYGDIVYEEGVLKKLMDSRHDITVVIDLNGADYFKARFGDRFLSSTESLVFGEDGSIVEIGSPNPDISRVQGQYIGLMKFSKEGLQVISKTYDQDRKDYWDKPWLRSKNFQNGYMTDMLQRLIDLGNKVYSVGINGGWLEFDSESDYKKYIEWHNDGRLNMYYSESILNP